jgi:hypothetical protein
MNNKFIFILFLGVSLAACKKANRFDCIKRTGEIKTESRALEYFDIIDVQNNVNVFLIQDSINFAEIKAGKNLISNIETSVVAHTLYIKNNNKCNFTRSYKHDLEIYIHFKKLNELIYKGTGPITSLNTIKNDSFTFNSWDGTDTVKLKLEVPLVYTNIHTGVADLIVEGGAEQLFAYAKGSGTFRMSAFKCTNVYTNNESSSDHYFFVLKKLEALVQYVGNTYYQGQPNEIIKTENAEGKLIQIP